MGGGARGVNPHGRVESSKARGNRGRGAGEAPGGGKWGAPWDRLCHWIRTAMPQEQELCRCSLEYPQMSLKNPQRRRVVQTMEKEWHGSRKGTVPGQPSHFSWRPGGSNP
ncbi:hypothetical protein GCM10020220_112440 [Nonomuraea rubra]